MSFFNDASIVQIPSGYKASTLYSIKPSSGAGDFSVTRNTTATRVNENGLIESVAANVPRIDYLNGDCGELLVEPQRTNLLTYSEQFDNAAWGKSASGTGSTPVVTANAGTAPDGTTTADRVQLDLNGGTTISDTSIISQSGTVSSGAQTEKSIFLKSFDGSSYDIIVYDGPTISGTSAIKVTLTNEWQRVSFVGSVSATISGITVGLRNGIGGVTGLSDTADVLVWGAQLEEGSYATSYIPTTTTTVTRNADVISLTNASALLGDSEGSLFVECAFQANDSNSRISISDGTISNTAQFGLNANGNTQADVVSGGVSQFSEFTSGLLSNSVSAKMAIKYKENDFSFWLNGVAAFTDNSGSTFANGTLTKVYFAGGSGTNEFYGRIRQLVVFDQALEDDELAAITS